MKHSETAKPIEGVDLPTPETFFEKLAEKLGATARAAHIFSSSLWASSR
jgi:hypothetical protein